MKYLKFCISIILILFFSCQRQKEEVKQSGLRPYKINERYGFYGYIDGKEIRIEPDYHYAEEFSEGRAVVGYNGKYGYVNEKGALVIPMMFDLAYRFSEGIAKVKKGDKYGYIDMDGKVIIDFIYDDAKDFKNGRAFVRKGTNQFYIFPDGSPVCISNTNQTFRRNLRNF
ncbi:MAG: WG repeat-containing protein [Brevinematia bacterium]